MNVLLIGGTGLSGAATALHLRDLGHAVTLMARKPPTANGLQDFPFLPGDYLAGIAIKTLQGFDALVFAAGADIRQLPPDTDPDGFFLKANADALCRIFAQAREAGIRRAVNVSSYYALVCPQTIATSNYVRSRHLGDSAIRALNSTDFQVCTLHAPFILGHVPGLEVPHLRALVQYAAGQLPLPLLAPAGGVNHISADSVAEAIASALVDGEPGRAYLLGDENLSWKTYLELFCTAAGNPQELTTSTEEHPLLVDAILYGGRNATLHYEADAGLRYGRQRMTATIQAVVDAYR